MTVVATGINGNAESKVKLVTSTKQEKVEISPSYMKPRVNNGAAVAQQLDNSHESEIIKADKDPMMSEDYLDIPAFLRNQAD